MSKILTLPLDEYEQLARDSRILEKIRTKLLTLKVSSSSYKTLTGYEGNEWLEIEEQKLQDLVIRCIRDLS